MKKKCQKCGNEFEPVQAYYNVCPKCFSASKGRARSIKGLLLDSYYDEGGTLLKDVYIGVPEDIARVFASDRPTLATKQLRDFHSALLRARNKALIHGFSKAKPILWECQRNAEYQLKRGVIPLSFKQFLDHHLGLAEKSEGMLEGFCEHLTSILAYFPKDKGGQG